jgi:transcriptional regulator with XRE-family HTH domain
MPRSKLPIPVQLKNRRKELGRSLRSAAEIGGVSNPKLCQLENEDETSLLTMSWLTLQRVCKAYGVAFDELHKKLIRVARREKAL